MALLTRSVTRPVERRSSQFRRLSGPNRNEQVAETVLTLLMLVTAMPVMAAAWVLVRLTSNGPAIYTQRRSGLRGREFQLHKFRSMKWQCEADTGAVWAALDDPRVTWFGALLRRTHLDELPQLFNVLRGEMALVGPRPERPEIIARLVRELPQYLERLEVRPGLTGLAQLFLGPDRTIEDVRKKVCVDRYYIAHRGLWLDLRILLCTALKVVGLNRPWVREILFPKAYAFVATL
jgi:lipopolysaccharide/colanic/teichoic acid biosynthesis glycosyltransferase